MHKSRRSLILFLIIAVLLLPACGKSTPAPTQSPTENQMPAETATSTATPARLVYVTSFPADSDPYATLISNFAAENALQYVPSTTLDASVLSTDIKIVVLQAATADLGATLDANPNVQFILLDSSELTGKSNLTTIAARPEDLYFMAGYLSTLIAYDWRSAGLVVNDGPLGTGAADAFVNGGKYVCGKCNPSYPPVVDLPQVSSLAGSAASSEWLAAANTMLLNGVRVMFVDAPAATPEVLSAVTNMAADLVGLVPPPEGTASNWAATVTSDASGALQQTLTDVLSGKGGQSVIVPVMLANVNTELVSPARQDLFNQVAAMVASGEIGTLSIPLE